MCGVASASLPKEMVVAYCVDPDNPLELDALWPEHRNHVSLVFEEPHYSPHDTIIEYAEPLKPTVRVFLIRHLRTDDVLCVRISDFNGNYPPRFRYKYLSLKKLPREMTDGDLLYFEL